MLSHCYAPSSFCISTLMVPIPKKSSGSIGEITNYRGIALSSLLFKIFDNCISNQYDSLYTNDIQFAYKSKTSTIHCVSSIFEGANHYGLPFCAIYRLYVLIL